MVLRVIIFCQGLEVFSLPTMEPSLSFPNVKSLQSQQQAFAFGSLRANKAVLVWKERFNTVGVLKKIFK